VMSAQPGRIVANIDVVTDQPRDAAFRGSDVFSQTVMQVVSALGEGALGEASSEEVAA